MTSRFLLPLALGFAALVSRAHAAAYSTNFNLFNPAADVAGQDGWVSNDATPNLSFIVDLNGSPAAGIGGFFDAPVGTSVDLTHAYGLSLSGSAFDVDLTVEPSTPTFPDRDEFGFSFTDGSSNRLLSVILRPNASIANQMEILWQGPTGAPVSTGFDLLTQGLYHLSIDFGASGVDGTFTASVTPQVGAPLNWNGVLTGAGAATIANLGLDWDVPGAASGDNFLIVDNLAMVPEPGSALLVGLGLLAAVRRRRTR